MIIISYTGNYTGLSSLPDHYIERSRCLDDFRDMYGGELILPHATFIMESLMKIPRRNRTYISRYRSLTRNASRSYFIRMHNITKSSINISDQQRTYGSFIAQRKQSYSHSNPQLRINNMTHSYMYHNVMLKSQKSRSYKNITVMQQRYYNAHQEAKHLRYFNATQLQTSYKQSYQQPSKGEQWRSFNGTQFWRQNNKPHLELKLKGGHGNNPVNKNSIR